MWHRTTLRERHHAASRYASIEHHVAPDHRRQSETAFLYDTLPDVIIRCPYRRSAGSLVRCGLQEAENFVSRARFVRCDQPRTNPIASASLLLPCARPGASVQRDGRSSRRRATSASSLPAPAAPAPPRSRRGNAPVPEPPESSVATLVSMGFDGNAARQALMRARNDINVATNILLESQAQ